MGGGNGRTKVNDCNVSPSRVGCKRAISQQFSRRLYDPLTMPKELLKAHQNLDRAVMKLYKFKSGMSESDIVAKLMEMYQQLTAPPTMIPEEETKKVRRGRKKK